MMHVDIYELKYVLIILLNVSVQVLAARQKCLTCSYISHPWFCDNYTHCEVGEICHIRKMITHNGHIQYTSGCVSDNSCSVDGSFHGSFGTPYGHVACVECCYGDFCNNKGCGDPGPPSRATRGPLCFQCENMTSPSDCRTLASCSSDQVCSITESLTDSGSIFTSACAAKNTCPQPHEVLGRDTNTPRKNKSPSRCHFCCSVDYCNTACPPNS